MADQTCNICVESFNMTTRKEVTCTNCSIDICAKCIKRYLGSTFAEPHCMQCKEVYTKEFMDTNFSERYRKMAFKEVRVKHVVDEEKKILPQLMKRAEAYKSWMDLDSDMRKKEKEAGKMRKELYNQELAMKQLLMSATPNTELIQESITNFEKLTAEMRAFNIALDQLFNERNRMYDIYMNGDNSSIIRVMKCVSDGCRGFLNNEYTCTLCNTQVCKDCHAVVHENHVCKQEDIDSVKLIREETRPCPSCQTNITKTDGCDQMWCTTCHTTFSWNTGRIETGRIHNPHYIAWVKQNNKIMPRELGDVPCGGMPEIKDVHKTFADVGVPKFYFAYVSAVHKLAVYVANQEMRRYPIQEGRCHDMNMISIKYMIGSVSETIWKNKLYTLAKTKEMNREKRLILDTLLACLIDCFRVIVLSTKVEDIMQVFEEMEELREYFNENMKNLSARFDIKASKQIPVDWCKLC